MEPGKTSTAEGGAMPHWHAMEPGEVAAHWGVDPRHGISDAEARLRLGRWGPNRPTPQERPGLFARFGRQLVQPLVLVLLVAGLVTLALGEWVDSGVIFGVVLINAVAGVVQEGRAEAALAALARALASDATVLREGAVQRLEAHRLVPGDVVVLAAGDRVPADLRLLHGRELRTSEAMLTGESVPADKHHAALAPQTPLADRRNMAWGGTLVVAGQGHGLVVATGDATAGGRIGALLAGAPELATPLTRRLDRFARQLLLGIGVLAALTFAVGMLRGEAALEMFMVAVALAVAAVPEGLPAALTITLAIGVAHMARRRAIVRNPQAVETLGSTTVVCSDKTGTLTQNAMTVRQAWTEGQVAAFTGSGWDPAGEVIVDGDPADLLRIDALRELLHAGALCNDARLCRADGAWCIAGDPTEAALLVAARKAGVDEQSALAAHPRCDELPFDPDRRSMATAHADGGACVLYVKGALERLLPACSRLLERGDGGLSERPLLAADRAEVEWQAMRMALDGMRVLAIARGAAPPTGVALQSAHLEAGLCLLGLVGMMDPPRPEAIAAVAACHGAGVRVKMITGDHPGTAVAVARQLGIVAEGAIALTGMDLTAMDDERLAKAAHDVHVFARVEPEQKLRLVRALQARGEVVAMTGDGVNDAPALRQADVGIAMGQGGTEVAKEAADIVLTDDNFATIETAIEDGRGIHDNIVKFIGWTLPTNAGEALAVLLAVLLGVALPVTSLQILWINMTTAILLGMMLAFEPVEPGVMRRPPRAPSAPILDGAMLQRTLIVAAFMVAAAFGLCGWSLRQGDSIEAARTVATNAFIAIETVYLFSCRSLREPVWQLPAFGNPWVWAGAGTMLALQLAWTYAPAFNALFGSAPIGAAQWLAIAFFAAGCSACVEMHKLMHGRRARHAPGCETGTPPPIPEPGPRTP